MPLLGPIYLGTILKNNGHDVEIYHEDICAPDYSKLEADVIGISILTSTAPRGYEIAKKFPKDKVIIGGVHASLLPEEAAPFARHVVVGEAEEIITDLVENRIKEHIVKGRPVENLDSLPRPDFSLVKEFNRRSFFMPISTSRGCPFDCSFCSVTKMFGRKYRFRSAENVIEELRDKRKRQIFFCDDNFTANLERTDKLLNLMLKNKINQWACQARCDIAKDTALLRKMYAAGCRVVCIGFESINQKTLKAFDKKQSVGQIKEAIRLFHKAKIKIHGMFVLGSDNDSAKTIWDTLKFAVKEGIDTLQMSILTPFPGTKVYDELEKEKRIFTKDWSLYDGHHIVFRPNLLSAKEMQLNMLKAYTRFYSLFMAFSALIKLRFRNAMFHFMGYVIVKKWKKQHRKMHWLPA
ncbi:MAG: B12-binding domain-containing radical SAM protein [Candidatus Omnitrophica bacterium]|nr:B12-binding domain-containing radical SAM protein [Candidatus Omnitrophota bacterium]